MTARSKYYRTALQLLNEQVYIEKALSSSEFEQILTSSRSEKEIIRQLLLRAPLKTSNRIYDIVISFDWEYL